MLVKLLRVIKIGKQLTKASRTGAIEGMEPTGSKKMPHSTKADLAWPNRLVCFNVIPLSL